MAGGASSVPFRTVDERVGQGQQGFRRERLAEPKLVPLNHKRDLLVAMLWAYSGSE